MPGQIKYMIDMIVVERSGGSETIASIIRTKLLLKGIDPSIYTKQSDDDPVVVKKLKEIAKEFGVYSI